MNACMAVSSFENAEKPKIILLMKNPSQNWVGDKSLSLWTWCICLINLKWCGKQVILMQKRTGVWNSPSGALFGKLGLAVIGFSKFELFGRS